jgi:hypothetical protein
MKKMYFLSLVLLLSGVSNVQASNISNTIGNISNTIESLFNLKTNEHFDALAYFNGFIENLTKLSFQELNAIGINYSDKVDDLTTKLSSLFGETLPESAKDVKKFAEPLIKNLATNFVNIKNKYAPTESAREKLLKDLETDFIEEQTAEVVKDYYRYQIPGVDDNRYEYDYQQARIALTKLESANKVAIEKKQAELNKAEQTALKKGSLSPNDRSRIIAKTKSDLEVFKAQLQEEVNNLKRKRVEIADNIDQAKARYEALKEFGISYDRDGKLVLNRTLLDKALGNYLTELLLKKGINETQSSDNFKKAIEVLRYTDAGIDGKYDTTVETRLTVKNAFDPVEPVKPVDPVDQPVDPVEPV